MKKILTVFLWVISVSVFAQTQNITGKITDASGVPLPGVTIVEKGTTNGGVTDIDGNYSVKGLSNKSILVYSFVGMTSQEIEVGNQTVIMVTMVSDAIGIEEVVAIGYGTRTKANLTGAIGSLSGDDMVKSPAANVIQSLAGQVSGVVINTRSGQPGAENTEMYIRGKATLSGSNSPLVLIDGVGGDLARLNPDDIESISVLKDASAAIYGVNASNGVILVTTKRGSGLGAQVTAKATWSVSQPTKKVNFTDNYQTALAINEYNSNKGIATVYSQEDLDHWKNGTDPIGHPTQDWYDYTYKDWAPQKRYSATVSGGTEKVKYYVSGDFLDQNSNYERGDAVYNKQYQVRSNLDFQATDNLKLSLDVYGIVKDRSAERFGAGHTMLAAKGMGPEITIFYEEDGLVGPGEKGKNPMIMGSKEVGYNATYQDNYQGIFRFDYKMDYLTKGLYTDGWVKYGANHSKQSFWENSWNVWSYNENTGTYEAIAGGETDTDPFLEKTFTESFSESMHAKLGYIRDFGDHSVDAFVAIESGEGKWEQLYGYRGDYPTNALQTINAGDESTDANSGYATESGSVNYFGRLNYAYKGKYLIDLTYRVDGSYKYAPGYRFGYFPGVSAAWRISEEEFFKGVGFINYAKLRGSWGKMGNNTAEAFQYLATYGATSAKDQKAYLGESGTPASSFYVSTYPNKELTWEVQSTFDVGLDLQFFDGLLDFTSDYFYSNRDQIAITRNASLPDYYGIPLPQENLGKVNSWGFDASLGYHKQFNSDWFFSAMGTFTFARNEVEYMDEAAGVEEWQKKEGHSVDVLFGEEDYNSYDGSYNTRLLYVADGIFQNQAEIDAYPHFEGTEPGDIKYIDYNDDDAITPADRVRFDKPITPEIVFGLSLTGKYKNIDLTARFQGQARSWRFIQPYAIRSDEEFFLNRWQEEGDNVYPRIYYKMGTSSNGNDVNDKRSTFWLEDASFVRLKTLELGYNLPSRLCEKIEVDELRLFVNGENLFCIDGIKISRDVELNNWGDYPILRIVSAGVSLKF
ncbi:SusC/RagA family TonB-linked outer membrane protein [Mangrovibacterium sp.]|uniref:SusC/RagA family TonB-linked outer membrane protein n=1 Tax=Mangrovibacterium sp. TaxID=1961364 RepID=UPI003566EEF8